MNSGSAFLGQVPLAGHISGLSLADGEELPVNGGIVTKRGGRLWFSPDPEDRAKLEDALGRDIPESVEARVSFCNPTPGTVPGLGDAVDPETGLVCFLELPEGWQDAWMWGAGDRVGSYEMPTGTPPYWGEWGVVDTDGGRCYDGGTVGPFDTIDEAFEAAIEAAVDHGASKMPLDGWAQTVDSNGDSVGTII